MKISELQASNPSVYSTDKFTGHAYGEFYDELFKGKENANLNILEIGVNEGGSVRLWHDYLKESIIIGLDVVDSWNGANKEYYLRLVLSLNTNAYSWSISLPFLDVIIEDGSHILADQIYALKNFPASLKSGGILVIEDVPSGVESEIIKHAPSGGTVEVINLRHVTGRWDDCLVTFKKKMNMNAKGIDVFIQEEYYSNSILVWVRDRSPHGEDNISFDGKNLVYSRIDMSTVSEPHVNPFMKLPMEFAFALFKAIFEYQSNKGIRTIDENLLTGKMEATERHLSDMREISKKLLDSTLNTK